MKILSLNAWETTSLTSLHPLTHFNCHAIILSLNPYITTSETSSPKRFCLLVDIEGNEMLFSLYI